MRYKYLRPETNTFEDVQEEVWQWRAVYQDGTTLEQFDSTGHFHQVKEIDQSKLHTFKMVSPGTDHVYTLLFNPDYQQLIHLYRMVVLDYMGPEPRKVKLYVYGYKNRVNGQTLFNIIMPNNELVTTDNLERIQID